MRIRSTLTYLLPLVSWLLLSIFSMGVHAAELYFIDAHSQVDHKLENLELIIQRMDEAGVYHTILAARSGRTPKEVVAFAEAHEGRIVPAVRTKGGAYRNDSPKYYKKMRNQLNSGQFRAVAEILLYHTQKGHRAPEVIVYPNDERVVFALGEAIEKGWPFVVHIEFQSLGRRQRQRFMAAMEEMLKAHPDHPFALNHMGQLDASEVRRLIETHKNIHFLTAHTNPFIIRHSNQPWVNIFDGKTLAPVWKELISQYPDRFIFALDNVWERHWREFYLDQMEYWRKAMADLPPNVAHAVAHGNAERLWKIPLKVDE